MTKKTPAGEPPPLDRLSPRQEACLKVAKEIAVKFIETGRMSVTSFEENFATIYNTVKDTVGK